ncbi:MAG TPA: tetratricopeptide repeat protein, partial [Polyangiales bacterium]|nr:tetratricopeptide repeat protein [Polyangiales bacterium]
MDVTCDRCGTDYEFEEALVSIRGTTVKCTQCGHLFKVFKHDTAAGPLPGPNDGDGNVVEAHPWTVRRADGTTQPLGSLADLTRLIKDGTFKRDDEVSRTGKAWKKIGEIAELRAFFPDAEPPPNPGRTRRHTTPELGLPSLLPPTDRDSAAPPLPRGVGSLPPSPPHPTTNAASLPPRITDTPTEPRQPSSGRPRRTSRFETLGAEVDLDGRGSDPHAAARPLPSPASSPDLDAATTSRRQAVTIDPPPEPRRPAREPARSSLGWLWAVLLLIAALGAAGFLLWPRLVERMTPPPPQDPTAEFVARADASFATHRIQHFEDAITEYVKALAFHENDPHLLSSISRVYAVWAQELLFKADATKTGRLNGNQKELDRRSELVALEKEERQLAEQAKRYAENAARKNPGNEEASVALADALRLTGNLVAARSELDRARANDATPSGETLRVAALLAIDEAKGDLRSGVKLASQAVAQEPDLIRTRLLLARCLVADGDLQGARYHLSAVETRDRSHPGVLAVQQAIERSQEPPPPSVADAGTDAATSGTPSKPAEPPIDPNAPPENLTHEGYVSRGQLLLERGEVSAAKRMFEQALFIRPSSARAHTGLGYVALEKGKPLLAVEHFLPAAHAGNLEAYIGLGDAYRRLDRPRDA